MKVPTKIRDALDATGLPWATEQGGAHVKLKLAGRLVGIVPGGGKRSAHDRAEKNTISQIRRAAEAMR